MSTENTTPVESKAQAIEIEDAFSIFDTNVDDITSFDEPTSTYVKKDFSTIFYEPDPQEKPYISVIKWLPNVYSHVNPLVSKFFYKLDNPNKAGEFVYWDSPSTLKKKCFVVDTWAGLSKSTDARDLQNAKKFSRKRQKCGVIQILRDPQKPELDGELRLFRLQYDGNIVEMLDSKVKPSKEDKELDPTLEGVNVFDPFGSPVMKIKAVKTDLGHGRSGRDLTGTTWVDKFEGMIIKLNNAEGVEEKITLTQEMKKDPRAKEYMTKVVELLRQDHVNINEHFAYKVASPEKVEFVKKAVEAMIGAPVAGVANAVASTDAPASAQVVNNQANPSPAPVTAETTTQAQVTPAVNTQNEVLDELFND